MTAILAIETSTPACSVSLAVGQKVFSRCCFEPRSHTRLIMQMIDAVLSDAELSVSDLDALAVTVGPGSFTGLRIGFSVAQGLAFSSDIPVIPVSTLQVIAQTYWRKNPLAASSEAVMTVLDARMGEFNCGAYQRDSLGQSYSVIDDQLLSREDALNVYVQLQPSAVIGEASQFFEAIENGQVMQDIYPEAEDLGALANGLYKMGAATAIEQVELVYLRGTDAWKKHTRVGMT